MKRILSLVALFVAAVMAGSTVRAAGSGTIVVVADTGNGASFQLYAVKPDAPGTFVQLTNLAPNPNFLFWTPQFSPDGKRIAFVYQGPYDSGPNAYIINADGSGLTQVTKDNSSWSTAWSADGSHILLGTSNTKTGLIALSTILPNGTGRTFVTDDLFTSFGGFSTPDGKEIVYESSDGGLVSAAWSISTSGAAQHRLTAAAGEMCPAAVSPDDRHVLLTNNCNTPLSQNLWTINVDGTGLRQLTNPGPSVTDFPGAYSPDGSRIAFTSTRSNPNGFDLWVMGSDGSSPHLLVSCPVLCLLPTWGR
jgi:Tol biopolymer transport system component